MILYLIKSGLCLAILLAFYHLVLEREKMHRFNRFYLLLSLLVAAVIPFISIEVGSDSSSEVLNQKILDHTFVNTEPIAEKSGFNFYNLAYIIYFLIASVLSFRFIRNILKLINKKAQNTFVNYKGATLILVEDKILPHSFWNYIYINKQQFENKEIEEELLTHELTHVKQKHTFDVLFLELLQILFWFNPLIFWVKKAIQLNHEFLADESVISSYKNISKYQYLLLDKATWNNAYYLASNLNYSLTKKRLLKMKTQNSKTTELLKKVAVLPLITGLLFLFANKIEAQKSKKNVKPVKIEVVKKPNKTAKTNTKEKELKYLEPVINKIGPKKFEELKNSNRYAICIDGKFVDNSTLNNYSPSDFATFYEGRVPKSARSTRFPQEIQCILYTNSYYNKRFKGAKIEVTN